MLIGQKLRFEVWVEVFVVKDDDDERKYLTGIIPGHRAKQANAGCIPFKRITFTLFKVGE